MIILYLVLAAFFSWMWVAMLQLLLAHHRITCQLPLKRLSLAALLGHGPLSIAKLPAWAATLFPFSALSRWVASLRPLLAHLATQPTLAGLWLNGYPVRWCWHSVIV